MSESILKKAAGTDKLPDKQEAEVEVNALMEGKTGKSGKTVIALLDEAKTVARIMHYVWADVSSAHTFAVVLSIWNSSARYGETSKRPLCRGRVL